MEKRHYNKEDGKYYRFKLAWKEDESNSWMTAYGDTYDFNGAFIVFHGSRGDMVLPPSVEWVIK